MQIVEAPGKEIPKKLKAVEPKENEKGNMKTEEDSQKIDEKTAEEKQTKENSKPPEPPKDYIHVRARRGQATDSHSLAERVSELISTILIRILMIILISVNFIFFF